MKILDEKDDTLLPEDAADARTQHQFNKNDTQLPGGLTQAQYLALNKKDSRIEITSYKKNLELAHQKKSRRQFSTGGLVSESSHSQNKLNVKNLKA